MYSCVQEVQSISRCTGERLPRGGGHSGSALPNSDAAPDVEPRGRWLRARYPVTGGSTPVSADLLGRQNKPPRPLTGGLLAVYAYPLMRLFMTYARENVDDVRELVDILSASGHEVWFDNQLLPGQDWKTELTHQISQCEAFVYALTHESVTSEWCEWELATAVSLRKAVLPVLLAAEVEVPQALNSLQFADFRHGATPIEAAKLITALGLMQKVPPNQSPPAPENPRGTPARAWENFRHWTDAVVGQQHQPRNETEEIQGKFAASLFRGLEPVSGRIVMTNQRLLFEANDRGNRQKSPLSIFLNDIVTVLPSTTLGIVPNGITVRTRSGEEFRFMVLGRRHEIIELIDGLRARPT